MYPLLLLHPLDYGRTCYISPLTAIPLDYRRTIADRVKSYCLSLGQIWPPISSRIYYSSLTFNFQNVVFIQRPRVCWCQPWWEGPCCPHRWTPPPCNRQRRPTRPQPPTCHDQSTNRLPLLLFLKQALTKWVWELFFIFSCIVEVKCFLFRDAWYLSLCACPNLLIAYCEILLPFAFLLP